MRERSHGIPAELTGLPKGSEIRIKGDPAQRHQNAKIRQQLDLTFQPMGAIANFFWKRLVVGRRTMHGAGNASVDETKSIAA